MSIQFKETYNLLKDYTHYTKPLSYNEWLALADDYKVGVLFVQFYEQISLAWYKLKTKAAIEEECVSEVLAYLSKNVYGKSYQQIHSQNVKKAKLLYATKDASKCPTRVDVENLRRAKALHKDEVREMEIQKAIDLHCDDVFIHFITTGRLMLSDDALISLLKPNERMTDKQILKLLAPQEAVSESDMLKWLDEDRLTETLKFNPATTKITEKTFTPSYIYRVVSNCIYCKSIDPYNGQTAKTSWYNNTTSNIVKHGDDVLDLFDTIPNHVDLFDQVQRDMDEKSFWALIEDQDEDTLHVIDCLLNGEKCKLSESKQSDIINRLQIILADFRPVYNN